MSIDLQFETVLAAAREGAEWALVDLYRDLHPRVLRYLRAKDPHEYEDLASEVWLDVAASIRRFEGDEAAFASWLFTIARRRLVDARRKAGRRRTDAVPVESFAHHASDDDVEGEVVGSAGFENLVARVRALPGDQAEVVLLRVVAGLEVDDVAAIIGKRPGTVRVLQHRALKRLAEALRADVTAEDVERCEGRDATQTR